MNYTLASEQINVLGFVYGLIHHAYCDDKNSVIKDMPEEQYLYILKVIHEIMGVSDEGQLIHRNNTDSLQTFASNIKAYGGIRRLFDSLEKVSPDYARQIDELYSAAVLGTYFTMDCSVCMEPCRH